ncbi:uncharacterized protein LOC135126882 [Zophobas morio]|uniref:uncharacterized protein LOC135126882 n=1 Tax=Zophobas morio TaxID=2755281 RepID=UPI003083513B
MARAKMACAKVSLRQSVAASKCLAPSRPRQVGRAKSAAPMIRSQVSEEYDYYPDESSEKAEPTPTKTAPDNELTHVRTKNLSGNVKLTTLQVLTTNTPLDKLNNEFENEEEHILAGATSVPGTWSENKQAEVQTVPENQQNVALLSELTTKAPTDGMESFGLMDVFNSTSGTLPDQDGTEKLITATPLNFELIHEEADSTTSISFPEKFVTGNSGLDDEFEKVFGAISTQTADSEDFAQKGTAEVSFIGGSISATPTDNPGKSTVDGFMNEKDMATDFITTQRYFEESSENRIEEMETSSTFQQPMTVMTSTYQYRSERVDSPSGDAFTTSISDPSIVTENNAHETKINTQLGNKYLVTDNELATTEEIRAKLNYLNLIVNTEKDLDQSREDIENLSSFIDVDEELLKGVIDESEEKTNLDENIEDVSMILNNYDEKNDKEMTDNFQFTVTSRDVLATEQTNELNYRTTLTTEQMPMIAESTVKTTEKLNEFQFQNSASTLDFQEQNSEVNYRITLTTEEMPVVTENVNSESTPGITEKLNKLEFQNSASTLNFHETTEYNHLEQDTKQTQTEDFGKFTPSFTEATTYRMFEYTSIPLTTEESTETKTNNLHIDEFRTVANNVVDTKPAVFNEMVTGSTFSTPETTLRNSAPTLNFHETTEYNHLEQDTKQTQTEDFGKFTPFFKEETTHRMMEYTSIPLTTEESTETKTNNLHMDEFTTAANNVVNTKQAVFNEMVTGSIFSTPETTLRNSAPTLNFHETTEYNHLEQDTKQTQTEDFGKFTPSFKEQTMHRMFEYTSIPLTTVESTETKTNNLHIDEFTTVANNVVNTKPVVFNEMVTDNIFSTPETTLRIATSSWLPNFNTLNEEEMTDNSQKMTTDNIFKITSTETTRNNEVTRTANNIVNTTPVGDFLQRNDNIFSTPETTLGIFTSSWLPNFNTINEAEMTDNSQKTTSDNVLKMTSTETTGNNEVTNEFTTIENNIVNTKPTDDSLQSTTFDKMVTDSIFSTPETTLKIAASSWSPSFTNTINEEEMAVTSDKVTTDNMFKTTSTETTTNNEVFAETVAGTSEDSSSAFSVSRTTEEFQETHDTTSTTQSQDISKYSNVVTEFILTSNFVLVQDKTKPSYEVSSTENNLKVDGIVRIGKEFSISTQESLTKKDDLFTAETEQTSVSSAGRTTPVFTTNTILDSGITEVTFSENSFHDEEKFTTKTDFTVSDKVTTELEIFTQTSEMPLRFETEVMKMSTNTIPDSENNDITVTEIYTPTEHEEVSTTDNKDYDLFTTTKTYESSTVNEVKTTTFSYEQKLQDDLVKLITTGFSSFLESFMQSTANETETATLSNSQEISKNIDMTTTENTEIINESTEFEEASKENIIDENFDKIDEYLTSSWKLEEENFETATKENSVTLSDTADEMDENSKAETSTIFLKQTFANTAEEYFKATTTTVTQSIKMSTIVDSLINSVDKKQDFNPTQSPSEKMEMKETEPQVTAKMDGKTLYFSIKITDNVSDSNLI